MSDDQLDENLQEFLEIRQPGVDYEAHTRSTTSRSRHRRRPAQLQEVPTRRRQRDLQEEGPRPARRGEGRSERRPPRLQRSVQSRSPVLRLLPRAARTHALDELRVLRPARRRVGVGSRRARVGEDAMQELQPSAWTNGVVPHVARIPRSGWRSTTSTNCPSSARASSFRSAPSSPIRATPSATRSGSSTCSSAATSSSCS